MEQMKITDELLSKILPKLSDEMIEEWEKKGDSNHQFSKDFERKMKTLIRKEKNKKLFKEINTVFKVAAGVTILLGGIFFFTKMDAKADPRVFFEKMEVILEDSSMYIYDEEHDNYNFTPYEPTYVPEGYEEVDRNIDERSMSVDYINDEGETISWRQQLIISGSILGMDSEYDELVVLEYAGENIMIRIYEDGFKSLYYESGNSIFMMRVDNISVEEMYEMVRQMEKVEK